MNKEEYSKYLNHPLWIEKREEVFRRYGRKCAKCGSGNFLAVHHKTYTPGKMPWEYPLENFEVFCEKCHKTTHSLEYTEKHCEGCGKVIPEKFSLCIACHNNEIKKNREEKERLASRINDLERRLQTAREPGKPVDLKEVRRLQEEHRRIASEKSEVENKLLNLEKARKEDTARVQSELSSLKKMIEGLDAKLETERSAGGIADQSVINRLEEERQSAVAEKARAEKTLTDFEIVRQADSHRMQSQLTSLKIMIIALAGIFVVLIVLGVAIYSPKDHSKTQKPEAVVPTVEPKKADPPPPPPPRATRTDTPRLDQIREYLGKSVTLDEVVSDVHYAKNGNVYLNIGGRYPNQKLSLVVFKGKVGEFGDLKGFENRTVRVRGKVSEYQGTLQIVLEEKSQIQVR